MFDENSALVQSWVRLIDCGAKEKKDVPNLSNLKEIVNAALAEA